LKLEYDESLSNFAGNFNLRNYITAMQFTSIYRHECVGWSAVSCVTPVAASGFTSFEIRMGDGELATNTIAFAFDVDPEVTSVDPPAGSSSGGTVVSLTGHHMTDHNRPLCRFGRSSPSLAYFVSSALMRCESVEHVEGFAHVEVSVSDEGQQYSKNAIAFGFSPDPRVLGVMPDEGVELGGTSLHVHGAYFAPGSVVRIGSVAPISARWLSGEVLETISLAYHPAGIRVPVEVSTVNGGSNTWTADEVAFTFTMPATLAAVDIPVSSVVGGSIVTLYGTGMFRQGATRWQCRFGDAYVDAFEDESSASNVMPNVMPGETCHGPRQAVQFGQSGAGDAHVGARCLGWSALSCVVPPSPAGFTTVDVAVEGEATPRTSLSFAFDAAASIVAAFPGESPSEGGGLVFVTGSHLRPGNDGETPPLCQFGSVPFDGAPAIAVSSALLLCEAPARVEGLVALAASVNDGGVTYSALAAGVGGTSGVQHFFAW
jgi:hypothetical protein